MLETVVSVIVITTTQACPLLVKHHQKCMAMVQLSMSPPSLSGSSELYHNRVNHTPDAKDRLSQLVCLADLQHHASKTLTGLRLHT